MRDANCSVVIGTAGVMPKMSLCAGRAVLGTSRGTRVVVIVCRRSYRIIAVMHVHGEDLEAAVSSSNS